MGNLFQLLYGTEGYNQTINRNPYVQGAVWRTAVERSLDEFQQLHELKSGRFAREKKEKKM